MTDIEFNMGDRQNIDDIAFGVFKNIPDKQANFWLVDNVINPVGTRKQDNRFMLSHYIGIQLK